MTSQHSRCRQAYFDEAMSYGDRLQTWTPRLVTDAELGHTPPTDFLFWATQINDELRFLSEHMQQMLSMGHVLEQADLECLRDVAGQAAELGQRAMPDENGTI